MPARELYIDPETSKAAYDAAVKLMAEIGGYFLKEKKHINEIIFVPMAIMSRVLRTHDAIVLLLKEEHYSEAAVLALTQFELRFDLLYVASDVRRATQWVEHDNPRATADSMKGKLRKLFSAAETDRLYETFGYLSGVKHGNPIYSELAFPGRSRRGALTISSGPIGDRFARSFSDALRAYSTYQVAWAAQVINKLGAKYAVTDMETRKRVHEHYMVLRPIEASFRRFLRRRVAGRKTFFGLKGLLSPKRTPLESGGRQRKRDH